MFSSLPRHRRSLQILSMTTLGLFLHFSFGCTEWRPAAIKDEKPDPQAQTKDLVKRIEPVELVGKRVRFHSDRGIAEMKVKEVTYPYARGTAKTSSKYSETYGSEGWTEAEIDLREVFSIEVQEINGGQTAALLIVTAAAIGIIVAVAVNRPEDPPPPPPPPSGTGGSCPLVYVQQDNGEQLVGELYAGAIFRSMQRKDLLPLPDAEGDRLSIRLANKARETQYTDLLELVNVAHAPGTRAVATNQQEVLLVGDTLPPLRVTDLDDHDVTAQTLSEDGNIWSTDLSRYLQDRNPPHKEGLVATFPAPPGDAHAVLELVAANTDWSEKTVERFFALTGNDYASFVDRGNLALAGPWMQLWSQREGLALAVEWKNGDTWERVATVTPIGPAALRHVAVPLPTPAATDASGNVVLRVLGGTGFWQFDEIALSTTRELTIESQNIAPVSAHNMRAEDEKDQLARIDARYQVLEKKGEELQLTFTVPAFPENQLCSRFLLASGYYNLHKPIAGMDAVAHYERIRDEPGGLARFGIDLYKAYYAAAEKLTQATQALPATE